MSEAFLLAAQGENMLYTANVRNVRNNFCTQLVLRRFELGTFVDAKIRASDKDLPVNKNIPVKNDQYIQGTS